jgi:hypothetical protein
MLMFSRLDRVLIPSLLGIAPLIVTGCGTSEAVNRPKTVPVTGVVLHDDKPVEGAIVMFVPQGHTNAAAGLTDTNGQFRLQTFAENDGAVAGDYKVTVRKVKTAAAASGSDDAPVPPGGETWLLPRKYGDATTTDLTATVTDAGDNTIELKLKGAPAGVIGGAPAGFKGNG